MKWVPAPLLLVLAPRGRFWGIVWLAVCAILSIATLPLTIIQLQALFGFGPRPLRLDYLVLLWAAVPWWWRHPQPLWWLVPRTWPMLAVRGRSAAVAYARSVRAAPREAIRSIGERGVAWARAFVGLTPSTKGS
jgi:hypothetical protein